MNKITSAGVAPLALAFPLNPKLLLVDLSDNPIEDEGAVLLAQGVAGMKSLAELGLSRIKATEVGERALKASAWRNAKDKKKSPPKITLGGAAEDFEFFDAEGEAGEEA